MEDNIANIKGIGKKTALVFKQLNINSTQDLLLRFPVKYENFEISELDFYNHNETITVKGVIYSKPIVKYFTNIKAISFDLLVHNEIVKILGFRKDYLIKTLKQEDFIVLKGKYNHERNEIVANTIQDAKKHLVIKPIYNIDKVLDINFSKIIKEIISNNEINFNENLPEAIINKYQFINRNTLVEKSHFPTNEDDLKHVYKRLKYEEAYIFQHLLIKKVNKPIVRSAKIYDLSKVKTLIDQIPFELTNDQKNGVNDCFKSFKLEEVSYRLIQGDVGSGKTIVAAIAIYGAITALEQVALMVPTEMLAKQHYEYFKNLYPSEVNIALLTSDTKNKKEIYEKLITHEIDLIIGTQALIEDVVTFKNLGLIVVDEQHKFGVRTRDNLMKKGLNADLIYLTATPIPRTLAISLFGEASITLIKEKPKNRIPVVTKYVLDSNKELIYNYINKTLSKGEKVFVVAPAIESDHANYNVSNLYIEYLKVFEKKDVYVLHGKLDNKTKTNVVDEFKNADKGILIATTMIEVGIDIKDATLIIIYAANYFGLSQLHQLRGRVGRASLLSTCLLVSSEDNNERLKILEKVDDGFLLSKYDLKSRGPGALIGLEQTGFPNFKYLDFIDDYEILKNARNDLYDIINKEKATQ